MKNSQVGPDTSRLGKSIPSSVAACLMCQAGPGWPVKLGVPG